MTIPRDGQVWAAAGETRPSRHHTVIARIPGHEGGVMFVRAGSELRCITASDWRAWVEETDAAPVEPEADPQPDWRGPMPPVSGQ